MPLTFTNFNKGMHSGDFFMNGDGYLLNNTTFNKNTDHAKDHYYSNH